MPGGRGWSISVEVLKMQSEEPNKDQMTGDTFDNRVQD